MHFVSGDVTKPVKSKAIVVQCVDDSGDWGTGGVFTALSNQTKQPELYYDLAGDMGDLQEGDVHLVTCDDVSDYPEYHVALLLAQDRKLRVKQSLLATCLKKLARASKDLGGVGVHLPRIGYNTAGFDWYSTERQLRKYLSNKKIHTYIYYYKRTKRQSTPPTNTAKRMRSQSPEEVCTDQSDADTADQSNFASTSTIQSKDISYLGVLEDLFTNINFFIDDSVGMNEKKRLKRYIIAFDGNVELSETEKTNFVVTVGSNDNPSNSSCISVDAEFIYNSICDGRVLVI